MSFKVFFKSCIYIDQHVKHRRRKIELPTDTQPQFELGDTAEDIERRRREREEREEKERREMQERWRTERGRDWTELETIGQFLLRI